MKSNGNENSNRIKIGDRVTIVPRGRRGTYTAEFSDYGVHRRVSLRTANQRIAKKHALRLEVKLEADEFQQRPKAVTLAQAVSDYLAVKKTDNRAPKTLVKYRTELEAFAAFAAERHVRTLQQVSASLFDQYRAARRDGRSEKSRYTEAIILKGFMKWCHRRELVAQDPFRFCALHKPPLVRKMAPSLDQVNSLLNAASAERLAQFALLAFTGMRAGELQMLRPGDVDLVGGWIHVVARVDWAPKNRRSRKIPIHPRLRTYLADLPKGERPYFFCAAPSPKYPAGGHQINVKHLNEGLQRLARRLKVPTGRKSDGLVVHSLRHFFETTATGGRRAASADGAQ